MITLSRNKKHSGPIPAVDGIPQTLAHSAEQTANRIAGAVEVGGARVAKTAGQAAGQASGYARGMRSPQHRPHLRRGRSGSKTDAMLKAQLAKTSRELAHESSDLNAAVSTLNAIIKKNRRHKARTRLFGGLAIGAALMYHFDPEHGRERRAATARMVSGGAQSTLKHP